MKLLTKFLNIFCYLKLLLSTLVSPGLALSIKGNQIMEDSTWVTQPLNIDADSGLVVFNDNVQVVTNYGELFVSQNQTSIIALGMTFLNYGNIFNYGTYILDVSITNTGSNVAFNGAKFLNEGKFYLNTKPNLIAPSYHNIWANHFINKGFIYFAQSDLGGAGQVALGKDATSSVVNFGTICIDDNVFNQMAAMQGNGCITAKETVKISINRYTGCQIFYLSSPDVSFTIAGTLPITPVIRGLQKGSAINFPFITNTIYYDLVIGILETTGILTNNLQKVDVGPGLKSFEFKNTGWLSSTVQYNGPVLSSVRPGICMPCGYFPICDVPDKSYSTIKHF